MQRTAYIVYAENFFYILYNTNKKSFGTKRMTAQQNYWYAIKRSRQRSTLKFPLFLLYPLWIQDCRGIPVIIVPNPAVLPYTLSPLSRVYHGYRRISAVPCGFLLLTHRRIRTITQLAILNRNGP